MWEKFRIFKGGWVGAEMRSGKINEKKFGISLDISGIFRILVL